MNKLIHKRELVEKLKVHPGLIPIDIDAKRQQIEWLDLEKFHSYESFFHLSLELFASLKKHSNLNGFLTDIDVLEDENIVPDYIYPNGFIFNLGRSGSTLLTRIIARSRENLVFSEAAPHNQIVLYLTENGTLPLESNRKNQTIYRNLILLMARKRVASHKYHLIKFTSHNIRSYRFIKSIFPDTPAIFIYREPRAVLKSYIENPVSWRKTLNEKTTEFLTGVTGRDLNRIEFERETLANLFGAALNAENIDYLNYEDLKPENLRKILSFLKIYPDEHSLTLMSKQFNYYSKSPTLQKFTPKAEPDETNYATPELNELFRIMKNRQTRFKF